MSSEQDYLRLELKAAQEGACVVRASTLLPHSMLGLPGRRLGSAKVCEITAAEFLSRYRQREEARGAEEQQLLALVNAELQVDRCEGDFEGGDDPSSPATHNADASVLRLATAAPMGPILATKPGENREETMVAWILVSA